MILIVVKFKTKPDWSDRWLDLVGNFTEDTRAEPANLWFEWSRSVDDPSEFVLVEAFEDEFRVGAALNGGHLSGRNAAGAELVNDVSGGRFDPGTPSGPPPPRATAPPGTGRG